MNFIGSNVYELVSHLRPRFGSPVGIHRLGATGSGLGATGSDWERNISTKNFLLYHLNIQIFGGSWAVFCLYLRAIKNFFDG